METIINRVNFIRLYTWYGSLADLIFSHTGISCDGYDTIDISLVAVVACGCVAIPVFVTGVALLGWSSFEFDTIQGNG